jgi:hypothetical protein
MFSASGKLQGNMTSFRSDQTMGTTAAVLVVHLSSFVSEHSRKPELSVKLHLQPRHLVPAGDGCVIAWCTVGGNAKVQFRKDDAHDYGILAMTLSNSGLMLLTASGVCIADNWSTTVGGTWTEPQCWLLSPLYCLQVNLTMQQNCSELEHVHTWKYPLGLPPCPALHS